MNSWSRLTNCATRTPGVRQSVHRPCQRRAAPSGACCEPSLLGPPNEHHSIFRVWIEYVVARLRYRVPSCHFRFIAQLLKHRLCFHKRSSDGSGKCNAFGTAASKDSVFGVVFEISSAESLPWIARRASERVTMTSVWGRGPLMDKRSKSKRILPITMRSTTGSSRILGTRISY
jgi:hypothetical protein